MLLQLSMLRLKTLNSNQRRRRKKSRLLCDLLPHQRVTCLAALETRMVSMRLNNLVAWLKDKLWLDSRTKMTLYLIGAQYEKQVSRNRK